MENTLFGTLPLQPVCCLSFVTGSWIPGPLQLGHPRLHKSPGQKTPMSTVVIDKTNTRVRGGWQTSATCGIDETCPGMPRPARLAVSLSAAQRIVMNQVPEPIPRLDLKSSLAFMSVKGMRRYGCQPTSLTGFGGFGEIIRFYLLFFILLAILTIGSLMVTFTCFPFSSSLTAFEGSVATYFEYLSCKPSGYEHGIHGMAKQKEAARRQNLLVASTYGFIILTLPNPQAFLPSSPSRQLHLAKFIFSTSSCQVQLLASLLSSFYLTL
ncbi:uncharacterized protein CLUP02_04050 [Colletotrichum lupini]|uniref:Uncharacterized protein n=1 Tax=Colletotrichum lupini TaxID=145971 RepID=A0A9Q8SK17_9PEZI|nr:uncharacterized protein CLUP02_04050 [Colletotrichum lupini]UQC78573.1 hypothetical protein CLUP02_04050 [Colletotrichum lupini]